MSDTTVGYRLATADSLDPALEDLLRAQVDDWMRGARHPLKVYLERQPELRGRPTVIVELINQEVLLRQERGETPRPEDYLAEYPELSESLIHLFEVHAAASVTGKLRDGSAIISSSNETSPAADFVARLPRIPGYDIERVLGRGGMGIVYLARHGALNRQVALKLLKESADDDPARLARFRREAAAAARCQHPNLVQIHDFDEHEGEFYLALEYVAGGHLGRTLAGEPQPPRREAELVESLARAIDHAHAQGVVHRDLKPANVLLTPDGQPKITDFGLAKLKDSSTHTEIGTLVGTLAYMAPEQVQSRLGEIGPRTDIHALGSILYEALTGRPPYRAGTAQQILHAILSEEVIPPSTRQPGIPRDLEAICLKCLEKEPGRRYATAADLAEDLRRFLDGRPTAARPASRTERCVRWCRRNRWIAAFLMALLVGVIGSTWQAVRATFAERSARRAEALTRTARDRAETKAEISRAVNDFLREDILGQASAENQARIDRRPDPDLKVRTALDYAAEKIGNRFTSRPIVEAAIRQTIGEAYMDIGLFAQARPHFDRAIELRARMLGENAPQTLVAKCRLGILLMSDGKLAEAERLLVPAMEGLRASNRMGPETLIAMQAVGALYCELERPAEAEKLLSETLRDSRAVRGAADPKTLGVANDLAMVYLDQHKAKEAERLLSDVIRGLEESVGSEHPVTLGARMNLAAVYESLRRVGEAEQLLKVVLSSQRHVLGQGHPSTLVTISMLAQQYLMQGKDDQAEPILLEALQECRKALDRNHLTTDSVLAQLAALYARKGDLRKVGQYLFEALEITRLRYGPDHGLTDAGTSAVASFYATISDFAKAEPFQRDHLEYCVRHNPDGASRYLAETNLGLCLVGRRAFPEAERVLERAHHWMTSPEHNTPAAVWNEFKASEDRVIRLYEAMGDKVRAGTWKVKRLDLDFPPDPFARP